MTPLNQPFISPQVRTLQPYQPGEQPLIDGLLKLNTNENPYPPSPEVIQAIGIAAAEGLQLYPDPESETLSASIAAYYGVGQEQVFVGNGSDEVLAHAFCALFRHGGAPLLMPDITYSFYEVYCRLFGIRAETVAADAALRVDIEGFILRAKACSEIAGIIIANPNAPTGEGLHLSAVRRLLEISPQRAVLVDEAYVDFGGDTAMALIDQYPNLLVVQTFSKSRALAGLRIGLAVGQPDIVAALKSVKNSFNSYPMDRLAQAGAAAALRDNTYFDTTRHAIITAREALREQMLELGFDVLPSRANFLFVHHPLHDAAKLAQQLRDAKILVRHFPHPRIEQFLRITIGTEEQCTYLVSALRRILSKAPA